MVSFAFIQDQPRWSRAVEALLAHEGPLWIWGAAGSGVSSFARWLAEARCSEFHDDVQDSDASRMEWLKQHPRGVFGSHRSPEDPAVLDLAVNCLAFRLLDLEDDPPLAEAAMRAFAREEGLESPLPAELWSLPCPGNLRGLRNRLLRWKLLGQLPEETPALLSPLLPLETEDIATNLHTLERILLHRALRRSYGNRVEAATRLGISRRQIYLLIARHGDPVRGEKPQNEGPMRLKKRKAAT